MLINIFVQTAVISLPQRPYSLGTGLLTNVNKENWKIKRRLIDPAFHRKYLKFMVPQMNSCCDILINKLAEKADGKTRVHMLNELTNLTLDVICRAWCRL